VITTAFTSVTLLGHVFAVFEYCEKQVND